MIFAYCRSFTESIKISWNLSLNAGIELVKPQLLVPNPGSGGVGGRGDIEKLKRRRPGLPANFYWSMLS
jgi:hypothetical protein